MDRLIKKYLFDIQHSIQEIESFLDARPRKFEVFCKDMMFRRAVERNIEIIGEAMSRILKAYPDISITSARKIVDTRNFVIHAYDSLQEDILWSIVINRLPLLKTEVEKLIESE